MQRLGDVRVFVAEEFSAHDQGFPVHGFRLGQLALPGEHEGQVIKRKRHFRMFIAQQFSAHCQGFSGERFGFVLALAVRKLESASLLVHCFGSTIMNWARTLDDPFELTLAEVARTVPRMLRLETKYVRIMSFKPGDRDYRIPREVFRRVREVTNRFLDAGLQPLHENCMNYGGMSWQHALELLDQCPGLKWLFDTANPIANPDRTKPKPWPKQDSWEFWEHVRDHVAHIHVKDAVWNSARKDADYCWAGDGHGRVLEILRDAAARGYDGGLSIEPHMVVVFHAVDQPIRTEADQRKNFLEYGRLVGEMIKDAKGKPIGPELAT